MSDKIVYVVIDAGCFENAHASGRIESILRESGFTFFAERHVLQSQIRRLWERPDGSFDDAGFEVVAALLRTASIETDMEAVTMLEFARELGDGDARTLTVAMHNGYAVATDDPKSIRMFRSLSSVAEVLSTTWLVKQYVERTGRLSETREILERIHSAVGFRPRQEDPLFSWWHKHLSK